MYVLCVCVRVNDGSRKKGDKRGLRRSRVRDRVGWILEGEGGGWAAAWRCGR